MIQKILEGTPNEIIRTVASFFLVSPIVPSDVTAIGASSSASSTSFPLSAVLDATISSWWISGLGTMPRGKGREHIEFLLSPSTSSSPNATQGGRVCRLFKFSIQIPPLPMGPLSVRKFRLERYVEEKKKKVDHPTTASNNPIPGSTADTKTSNEPSSSLAVSSSSLGGSWKPCSPIWIVENRSGWQEYVLDPPIDLRSVRVVCLTNQMHEILNQNHATARNNRNARNGNDSDDDDGEEEEEDNDEDGNNANALRNRYSCVGYYCVKFE